MAMTMNMNRSKFAGRQHGAALVVSLILLMMLTLLAISTMSTASLEVTMAGNDQFGENAFQLAETANEQMLRQIETNPALCVNDQDDFLCDIAVTAVAEMGGSFQTQNDFIVESGSCPLSSEDEVKRFNFETLSTGNAADNAVSQHTQGWTYCKP